MKKLISLLSAVALFATLLTTVAFADANNKYYIEESRDGNLVTLHFYLKTDKSITQASNTLSTADAADKGATISSYTQGAGADTFVGQMGSTAKKKTISWTIAKVAGATGTLDLGTVVFDISGATGNFNLPVYSTRSFTAQLSDGSYVTSSFTDTATNYEVVVGGGDPVVAEKDTTTGVVAFDYTNATEEASSVLSGQKIKLFSETFTSVTSDTRFKITHNGTYKVFGSTLGEYLGISGGSLSGSLAVAVLFPEGDNTNFDIEKIN